MSHPCHQYMLSRGLPLFPLLPSFWVAWKPILAHISVPHNGLDDSISEVKLLVPLQPPLRFSLLLPSQPGPLTITSLVDPVTYNPHIECEGIAQDMNIEPQLTSCYITRSDRLDALN